MAPREQLPLAAPGGKPTWPTVIEAVDAVFTWFDTDADGTIKVAEIVGVIDPGGTHADQLNTVVTRFIGLIDENEDDALSNDEVSAALTQLDHNGDGTLSPVDLGPALARDATAPLLAVVLQGGPLPGAGGPPQAPTVDQVADALLARFDADDDGAITLAELTAVLDPRGVRSKIADALALLVNAVDADDSGAMSDAELTAAVATLDADGNGMLNHDDHVPGPPGGEDVDLIGLLLPKLRQFDAATLNDFG